MWESVHHLQTLALCVQSCAQIALCVQVNNNAFTWPPLVGLSCALVHLVCVPISATFMILVAILVQGIFLICWAMSVAILLNLCAMCIVLYHASERVGRCKAKGIEDG